MGVGKCSIKACCELLNKEKDSIYNINDNTEEELTKSKQSLEAKKRIRIKEKYDNETLSKQNQANLFYSGDNSVLSDIKYFSSFGVLSVSSVSLVL